MRDMFTVLVALAAVACSPANDGGALGEGALGQAEEMEEAVEARDGPFGFDMGQSIDEVAGASKLDTPGFYVVDSAPKAHPDFEAVVLEAYPDTGICMIRGIGRNIVGDGAGSAIRSKVDSLAKALETKYGEPEKGDVCIANRIKCNPDFWMMTLDDNERMYGFRWSKQNEQMSSADIGLLGVQAKAANIQDTYPLLEFQSSNTKTCEAARNASSADAL